MSYPVNTVANTDTFQKWLDTTNILANLMSNSVLTTGSTANGDLSVTGNVSCNTLSSNSVYSSSIFNNNTISTNQVYFSTSLVNFYPNNSIATIVGSGSIYLSSNGSSINILAPSNNQIANGQYYWNANGSWSTVATVVYPLANTILNTNTTNTTVVDSWSISNNNVATYTINVKDNNANNLYSTSLLVTHDGTNGLITEYAQIITNTNIGTFSASSNSTSVILNFNPISSNTTIKYFRVLL